MGGNQIFVLESEQRNNYSLLAWFGNLVHSGSSPWTCRACRTSCWSCPAACPSPAACSPSPACSCQRHAAASQGLCSAWSAHHPPFPCPPQPGSTGSRRGRGVSLPDKMQILFFFNFPSFCKSLDVINQNKCSFPMYSNTTIINSVHVTALNSEIEKLCK